MFTSFATFFHLISKSSTTISINSINTISKISFFVISFAISRNHLFSIEIILRSTILFLRLRFSIATSKNVLKMTKIASIICSFISSFIFFRKSISKHQKQIFYFIIDNLYRMFVENFKSIDLSQHQIRRFFSSNVDFRQSIKRNFIQIRIIFYFRFAINQNKLIIQNSKISNSKNFRQRMFAKTIRIILFFKSIKSEISIISSYKMSSIFRFKSMIKFSKFSIHSTFFFIFEIFVNISNFCQICRVCNDIFKLNVDLQHIYDRFISVKNFATIRKIFENAIAFMISLERIIEKWNFIFLLFVYIIIRFFRWWIIHLTYMTQRKRCDFFRSMTFVTINFHITLKSKYLDKNELTFWQSDSYFAFCFLDSQNSIILFFTLYILQLFHNKKRTRLIVWFR